MGIFEELTARYPALKDCAEDIKKLTDELVSCFRNGGKLLLCGNGGSCADCEHIVGELMKSFLVYRRVNEQFLKKISDKFGAEDASMFEKSLEGSLPAISLPHQAGVLSAFANDVNPTTMYAQLVYGYARPGDMLLCISTSGNSANCVAAAKVGAALGIKTAALTGEGGGKLSQICDICVKAPSKETFKIQEYHLPIYHAICAEVERQMFGNEKRH